MQLIEQWLFTSEWRQRTAQALRLARRLQPPLPARSEGEWRFEQGRAWIFATWRQTGFSTKDHLASRSGAFVEIGGPTPLWQQYDDDFFDPSWGEEVDPANLPQPLIVTNLVPAETVLFFGPAAGDAFVRADATRLPFRDGSLGAVFCRGLSVIQPTEPDESENGTRALSRMLRFGAFEEVWRCLEPDGVFYLCGAGHADLSLLRWRGFRLVMFHGAPDASRYRAVFREVVFLKPLGP